MEMIKKWSSGAIAYDSVAEVEIELAVDRAEYPNHFSAVRDVSVFASVASGYDDQIALHVSNDGGTTYLPHTTGINSTRRISVDDTITDIKLVPTGGGAVGTITLLISARVAGWRA